MRMRTMRGSGRAGLVAVAAAGLVVAVAGCEGSEAPAGAPAPAMAGRTTAAAPGSNAGADESAPVPDTGVKTLFDSPAPGAPKRPAVGPGETTAPGTRLRVGEPALVRYDGASTGVTVVEVVVTSVEAGQISDLAGFDLPADVQAATPYYVKLRWTNRGKSTLRYPGLAAPTVAFTASGAEASPLTLDGEFPRCDTVGASPSEFAPEISVSGCRVFLVPAGRSVALVGWSGSFRDDPVLWSAG